MKIDLKKYKRIFAFGCSFTAYKWPTWADLIAVETKAEYYNYGVAGMGNLGIMSRIIEANARYKFNEDDLVMVMWSTYSREDRWINGSWFAMGNVWNSQYPDDWVRDYCDPVGYLIRDHAIINQTNKMLKESKAGSVILRSVPFNHSEGIEADNPDVLAILSLLYQREYNELPMSLFDFVGRDWTRDPVTYIGNDGQEQTDPHPKTMLYYDYLESCGLEFSNTTKDYAIYTTAALSQCKTLRHIRQSFDQPIRNLLSRDFKPLL